MKKRILLLIVILLGTNFYQFKEFSSLSNNFRIIGLCIIFLIIISCKPSKLLKPSSKYLNLYLIGILLSIISCYLFWNQSVILTVFSLKTYMFVFIYYALHRLKPTIQDVYFVITLIAIGYSIIYLLNYSMYPDHLFGSKSSERRGTFTFHILGSIFCVFSSLRYFSLVFIEKTKSKTHLFLFLLFILVIILRASRTQIFAILLPMVIYYFVKGRFTPKKIMSSILIVLLGYLFFVGFEDIFSSFYLKTLSDVGEGNDNIRLLSANYYLFEHAPSNWNIFFGNGMFNGASKYGDYVMNTLWPSGFYAEDVGLIGFWSYFGFITLLAYFRILSIFFRKYNFVHIRIFGSYLILMSITTYDSYQADSLILQPMLLYISDILYTQQYMYKAKLI